MRRPNRERGDIPILVAVATAVLFFLGTSAVQMSVRSKSKSRIQLGSFEEGFYAAEISAWHSLARAEAGLSPVGTADADGSYSTGIEVEYSTGTGGGASSSGPVFDPHSYIPGTPLTKEVTATLDSSKTVIRRLASNDVRYTPAASGVVTKACGQANFSDSEKYQVCLASGMTVDLKAATVLAGPYSDGPLFVNVGATHFIQWTSTGATSCAVTAVPAIGPISGLSHTGLMIPAFPPATSEVTYTLTCNGPAGIAADTLTVRFQGVNVEGAGATLAWSNGPVLVVWGTDAHIRWSSHNMTSCTLTPSEASMPTFTGISSADENLGPLPVPIVVYTANCTGPGGASSDSVVLRRSGNIFVTSTHVSRALGSREAYHSVCNARAAAAGLSGPGVDWRPVMCLSLNTANSAGYHSASVAAADAGFPLNARDYVVINGPIVNMNGNIVANSAAQFWSGSHSAPFNYTEFSALFSGFHGNEHIITGCNELGMYVTDVHPWSNIGHSGMAAGTVHDSTANCNNFRNSSNSGPYCVDGWSARTDAQWAKHYIRSSCDGNAPIACVRQ